MPYKNGGETPLTPSRRPKTIGILQPSYLPWAGFFEQLDYSDVFVIYDDVQYEKGSWRNRNRIKTPNGIEWLTVPVFTKGQKDQLIKDVKINNTVKWAQKHIKTITQNYRNAPFFNDISEPVFSIISSNWQFLIDLNMSLIEFFVRELQINTQLVLASSLQATGKSTERLINIIKELDGTCFYEGAAGKNYLQEDLFPKNGITLTYQEFTPMAYKQMYGDFISHLSIIDLLFNCGFESRNFISNSKGMQ